MRKRSTMVPFFDNQVVARHGCVLRKPGSSRLYIKFDYFGKRIEKSTGGSDTPSNRRRLAEWLERIIGQLNQRTVRFAELFPRASETEKEVFSELEGQVYAPRPQDVLICDYIKRWRQEVLVNFHSAGNKFDYDVILRCWIESYFKGLTFNDLTRVEVQKFIGTFKCKIGVRKGLPLSKSRSTNILTVLRTIFNDAVDQYHWDMLDPLRLAKRYLPKVRPKIRDIFYYDEWIEIIKQIDDWYRPAIDMMMLTGMIHSEIAGLQRTDIRLDHILVQTSIVRDIQSDRLKTPARVRRIPLTKRIRQVVEFAMSRTSSQFIFANPDGQPYRREGVVERVWHKAIEKAGVPYRPHYSIRHSFAAWSLAAGVEPLRLVALMGHASKQLVFDVYSVRTSGIEQDYWCILDYFGKDYIEVKSRRPATWLGESACVENHYKIQAPESFSGESSGESPVKTQGLISASV